MARRNATAEDLKGFATPNPVARMTQEQILTSNLHPDFMKHVSIQHEYVIGNLEHPAQIMLAGEASVIYSFQWNAGYSAFISNDYGMGFQIRSGKHDTRLDDFLITDKETPPIKGNAYDVYILRAHADKTMRREDNPDEYFLQHSDFNGGAILYHPATIALDIVSGKHLYIRGDIKKRMNLMLKAAQGALWRMNGYFYPDFKAEWEKRHKSEEAAK